MKDSLLHVVIEHRFFKCSEGFYWSENSYEFSFWERYLQVYDSVVIVARVSSLEKHKLDTKKMKRVDGTQVLFFEVPYYLGPKQFILSLPKIIFRFLRYRNRLKGDVILRYPSILAPLFYYLSIRKGTRVGVEVVGDPKDTFSEGDKANFTLKIYRNIFIKTQEIACKMADSISYVTKYKLQERYPPKPDAFQTYYSSIDLRDRDFQIRMSYELGPQIKLLCIGNLSFDYKGCSLALEIVKLLVSKGINTQLTWIGGGILQSKYEEQAKEMNISEHVDFVGNLSDRQAINSFIDSCDLFLLTSKQEGLPRVLLENMARSLYCLSTNVGGVSELLDSRFISAIDDAYSFVNKIHEFYKMDESERLKVSEKNFSKATEYHLDELTARRTQMYKNLKGFA